MVGPVKQEPHIHIRTLWVKSQESYPGISSLGVPPTLQRFFFSLIYVCSTLKQQNTKCWELLSLEPPLRHGENPATWQGNKWLKCRVSHRARSKAEVKLLPRLQRCNPRCAPWLPDRRETRAAVLTCPHAVTTALPTDFGFCLPGVLLMILTFSVFLPWLHNNQTTNKRE